MRRHLTARSAVFSSISTSISTLTVGMAVETVGNVGPDDPFFSWVGEVDFGLLGRGGCDDDNEPALRVAVGKALLVALLEDVLLVWSEVNTNFSFLVGGAVPLPPPPAAADNETKHTQKSKRWVRIRWGVNYNRVGS